MRALTLDRSRSRLTDRQPLRAQRTSIRFVRLQIDLQQGRIGDVERRPSAGAVDDRRDADSAATGGGGDLHGLARRSTRGEHILDHQNAIVLTEHEPAPQSELAVLPLREYGADTERTTDFVTDDDAAERRREHDRRAQFARLLRD